MLLLAAAPVPSPAAAPGVGCPSGQTTISVRNRRGVGSATTVLLSGRLVGDSCAAGADTTYVRSVAVPGTCDGTCSCEGAAACTCEAGGVPRCDYALANLGPGEWVHRVEVPDSRQRQAQRALVMGDTTPATLAWTAFRSVLTVNSPRDDGQPGTLRHAIATASGDRAAPPSLIQFERPPASGPLVVRLTGTARLRVEAETVIDGTDADGNPSPLAPFNARVYPTVIELDPIDKSAAHAATLRITSPGSGLRGVFLRRLLGADALISRLDQDLVAFGPRARGGFVDTCRLDGGSAHRGMQSCPANSRTQATNPSQGKDCVDVEATGSRAAADAVVITQSELRHCYDRAVKSQDAATLVRRSWIHHNGRGGLFAQNPHGRLEAVDNLIEENGRNCPGATRCAGGLRDGLPCCTFGTIGAECRPAAALPAACPGSADTGCGTGVCRSLDAVVDPSQAACGSTDVRPAAAQLSAERGTGAGLFLRRNIVRHGPRSGVFLRDGSTAALQDDYLCGLDLGLEATAGAGAGAPIAVRGAASALNRRAGVLLAVKRATVAEIDLGAAHAPGLNAFTDNGDGRRATNVNMGAVRTRRPALHNQWQHGGGGASCRAATVTTRDVANANPALAVAPCEAPRNPSGGTSVREVVPAAARAGEVVRILGSGFNAIDGYGANDGRGGATRCTDLAAGNTCEQLPRGTCVEFERLDGSWAPATEVLAVTPTHIAVRAPIDCLAPRRVRVRRKDATGRGQTFTSSSAVFCRNE